MDKVLLIGKFTDSTKHLQKELKPYMAVQLCSDHEEVISGMIQMYQPVLLLVSLDGFTSEQEGLLRELFSNYKEFPIVIFGTEEQREAFSSFGEVLLSRYVTMPMDVQEILQYLKEHTSLVIGENDNLAQTQPKLILLVDDSPVLLRSMKHMLENEYRIAMATSGKQAMEMIEKEVPDLVILDYEMPGYDGKQTLEMIREKEGMEETPVVFLTGHGDSDHIRSVLDLNPAAYFSKPPKAEKIFEILQQLL